MRLFAISQFSYIRIFI